MKKKNSFKKVKKYPDGGKITKRKILKDKVTEYDPEFIFSDRFNTRLSKKDRPNFELWSITPNQDNRIPLNDIGAYDVQGYWKDYIKKGINPNDVDNHGPDTYKKPNHPTFSNESKYSNIRWEGGSWEENGAYNPSDFTKHLYEKDYYNKLFGNEPNRPEHLGKYAQGGILNNMKLKRKKKYAVGAIIGAISGGMQSGNSMFQPLRDWGEQIDPQTGEYVNRNRAVEMGVAGSFANPMKAATDPDATGGEKLLGLIGLGAFAQPGKYKRLERERKQQIWNTQHPNTIGESQNPYYMARGGMLPGMQFAELENGEVFRTPDGNIKGVNGASHSQGGEDFMLSGGTEILGKNISKKYQERFKDIGMRLKKSQGKHQKVLDSNLPPIAKRTSEIMLDRISQEYTDLMKEQEIDKVKKAFKKFAKGGTIHINPENKGKFNALKKRTGKSTEELTHSSNPLTRKRAIFAQNAKKWKHAGGDVIPYEYKAMDFSNAQDERERINYLNSLSGPEPPMYPIFNTVPIQQGSTQTKPSFLDRLGSVNTKNTLDTISELAPAAYNIGQGLFGKTDKYNYRDYTNPYIGDIRSTMRNRRYNIQPELDTNRVTQATYNYNLRNAGASRSQLQGGLEAGSTSRMRMDSAARAQQNNMNNQYLSEQAQMDYGLGENISKLKHYGYEANLRNRGAKKNYLSTGLSQLQQYSQMKKLMKNQKETDTMKTKALSEMYSNFKYNPELLDKMFDFLQSKEGTE